MNEINRWNLLPHCLHDACFDISYLSWAIIFAKLQLGAGFTIMVWVVGMEEDLASAGPVNAWVLL